MKNTLLFIATLIMVNNVFAQNISIKHNIIYASNKPYAQLKNFKNNPLNCTVSSLDGQELISIHHSRLYIKDKPGYCVTFLNDNKKALMVTNAKTATSIMKEIVKANLLTDGTSINESAKLQYIQTHPLPAGYIDVNDIYDPLVERR